jgi:hypothetical protein
VVEGFSLLLRTLYSRWPHPTPTPVERAGLPWQWRPAGCALAAVDPALEQDEIELMLQKKRQATRLGLGAAGRFQR